MRMLNWSAVHCVTVFRSAPNLTGVAEAVAYRIVDFSAGVVFGVRGSLERRHSARVPVEPGAGEHQGRRADKTSLGTRFVR